MAEKKSEEKEIDWRAAEYEHSEKSAGWYFIIGAATLLLLVLAVWQSNFFFGIFVLLAGIMVIATANKKPDVLDFRLTAEGCELGRGKFYKYEQLENFSLRNRPDRLDEFILKRRVSFNPFVRVPVDSRTAEKIKVFLVQKLPEAKYEESFLDVLIDFLGF